MNKKKKKNRDTDTLSELGYGTDPRDAYGYNEDEWSHPNSIFKKGDVVRLREETVKHYRSMPNYPEVTETGMIIEIGTHGIDGQLGWYEILHTNGIIESWEYTNIVKLISPGPGWPNTTN